MTVQQKYQNLQKILKSLGKVIIAYSGGVDSTFLLRAAVDTLGTENVLACIGIGPSLPRSQYAQALELAKDMGANIETVEPNEMADKTYLANKADRCFHCKSHLLKTLTALAKEKKFNYVLCGTNFDDLDDFRPGNRAVKKLGVKCPLSDAELTKSDIRQLSRELNLPTADIPASPCLASRISYGLEITDQRLKQVEEAEEFLKGLGFVEFRVRHHDRLARIEVEKEDIEKISVEAIRTQIVEKLKSLGFQFVALDLAGFRSGSMNDMLTKEEKQKSL
jgi:pyridinium-3,5-biscarboxylic acid mononucleotide sulfurtransferase